MRGLVRSYVTLAYNEYSNDIPQSSHRALGGQTIICDNIVMTWTSGPITVFVLYWHTHHKISYFLKLSILSSGMCRMQPGISLMALKMTVRVSKHVTNRSKTVVIDVICFLCVSLASSAVLVHDSWF
jgi:hypothetical protein